MGTLQIRNLTFRYTNMEKPLFDNVTLKIDESWRLGLIGRNGRGKTTLLRLLQNQLTYSGTIETNLDFSYFPQPIQDPAQMTLNVAADLGQVADYETWKIERELARLHVDSGVLYRPFNTLSPGEQTKVLLAGMFADDTHFQLIDEPTNHLDQMGRTTVADYLRQKTGFILVSHDRHFLNQIIDHVISIDRANIAVYSGNYETWYTAKTRQDTLEQRENDQLKSEIKRLEKTAQQKEQWSNKAERGKYAGGKRKDSSDIDRGFVGHRAAKVMKRSVTLEKRTNNALNDKKKLLNNLEDMAALTLPYQEARTDQTLVTVADLVLQHNQEALNQPLSFTVKTGDRIALIGPNGAGKSTLIHALLDGQQSPLIRSGSAHIHNGVRVSYLPQDFANLSGTIKNFASEHEVAFDMLLATLRKLGFERQLFNDRIENMSMGQKRKLALARSLCESAQLYIWDEPLNYLDVITREQVQQVISEVRPTLLLVDHDRDFVNAVTTMKIRLEHIR
ncbi:ABC-F type ribosomal protection protein [Sporolactobacillus shoreae]|uniref:ABC-F type ribosomal protection protein n=1 Tax=Sporolactobacillus shoreae TaxID=1465501 RepID=A0A4Z0GGN3_9BACL|nr:ABC-F type ribosomal protection protein [Sporolactobacillus shoreae]TGA95766.1 ABC-F type ribosomal protection protein [Sporolactobacillus shoreae]